MEIWIGSEIHRERENRCTLSETDWTRENMTEQRREPGDSLRGRDGGTINQSNCGRGERGRERQPHHPSKSERRE